MSDFKAMMHQNSMSAAAGAPPQIQPGRGAYGAPGSSRPIAVFKKPSSNGREEERRKGK